MRVVTMVIAAALFEWSGVAAQAEGNWYISGSLGAYIPSAESQSQTFLIPGSSAGGAPIAAGAAAPLSPLSNLLPARTATNTQTLTNQTGPFVSLGLGYRLPYHLRLEGEVGYTRFNSDTVQTTSVITGLPVSSQTLAVTSGGVRQRVTATVNLFYDLPVDGPLVPYIGVGVGAYRGWAGNGQAVGGTPLSPNLLLPIAAGAFSNFPITADFLGHSVTNAVVLAEVGVSMTITPNLSIGPAYRYMHLFVNGNTSAENAHIFKIGARYAF